MHTQAYAHAHTYGGGGRDIVIGTHTHTRTREERAVSGAIEQLRHFDQGAPGAGRGGELSLGQNAEPWA